MTPPAATPPDDDSPRDGLVVARFRRDFLVEDHAGGVHRCLAGRRDLRPLAGDRVSFVPERPGEAARIVAVGTRHSCLERIDSRGRREALAANLTQLAVVLAAQPSPDLFTADRYLSAAELMSLGALVIANKCDIEPDARGHLGEALADYRRIGYPVIETSAASGKGLDELAGALHGHRSSFVGQSGVGKSSLVNRLVPDAGQAVDVLSRRSGEGRHTTTTAVAHRLPGGGHVIDSPGVRGFSPPLPEPSRIQHGYREVRAHAAGCRFGDCLHREEPGCKVKMAVEEGNISERRYKSYCSQIELAERLGTPRGRQPPRPRR